LAGKPQNLSLPAFISVGGTVSDATMGGRFHPPAQLHNRDRL
jgi:hypothetical protein